MKLEFKKVEDVWVLGPLSFTADRSKAMADANCFLIPKLKNIKLQADAWTIICTTLSHWSNSVGFNQ